jgi:hypothetical protein
MVIASSIEGRLRIRDEGLTKEEMAHAVRDTLLAIPGVDEVTVNRRVGSLLIVYGKAVSGVERILTALADLFGLNASPAKEFEDTTPALRLPRISLDRKISRRAVVNLGMLSSLLVSMVGVLLDATGLHVAAGVIFLVLFGIHVFERRKSLF